MPHRRWTVGALSTALGIAAPTLRTWERRYGVGPTFRTVGGHRRYTVVDADRVATMAKFIQGGMSTRQAADRVKKMSPHEVAAMIGAGPQGLQALVRDHAISEIVTGAQTFDIDTIAESADEALLQFGAAVAWDSAFAPAVEEVHERAAAGPLGIAGERLVRTCLLTVLRLAASRACPSGPARIVTLGVDDDSELPVAALGTGLACHGHGSIELGTRLPCEVLEAFVDHRQPAAVVLWATNPSVVSEEPRRWRALEHRVRVVFAGDGWPETAAPARSMVATVDRVKDLLADELG